MLSWLHDYIKIALFDVALKFLKGRVNLNEIQLVAQILIWIYAYIWNAY